MRNLLVEVCFLRDPRFIFITGGTLSSLGKGLTSASLGSLLKEQGYTVQLKKLDPYLNIDPGTMSPQQHGEVFVTEDGTECDLDFGHYERFTGQYSKGTDSLTSGRLYDTILKKERKGDFLGNTVQVIPHVTNEIQSFITQTDPGVDFVLCEIGGTVGDIEGLPYLEAIRQLRNSLTPQRSLFLHLVWIPYVPMAKELKTKPAQHSVKEMQRSGIQPDVILCRCDRPLPLPLREKLSSLCNVSLENILEAQDCSNIYQVPGAYSKVGLESQILRHFDMSPKSLGLPPKWEAIEALLRSSENGPLVHVGIVGKYDNFQESYKSLNEALVHGALANGARTKVHFISGNDLEGLSDHECQESLASMDGIIVPGGFGDRGTQGKIKAITACRQGSKPILGICLGFQLMVVEAARNLAGLCQAHSTEFLENTEDPVISLLEEWLDQDESLQRLQENLGGTMRLGSYACELQPHSKIAQIYGSHTLKERHRHRYEMNNAYREPLEKVGIRFTGHFAKKHLLETLELPSHPWFIGVQFHPEFKSRPDLPHPLFTSFIQSCLRGSLGKKPN